MKQLGIFSLREVLCALLHVTTILGREIRHKYVHSVHCCCLCVYRPMQDRWRGGGQGHFAQALGQGSPMYTLVLFKNYSNKGTRGFRLIELLTHYYWRFIDIPLHSLDNFKLKNVCIVVRQLHCVYFNNILEPASSTCYCHFRFSCQNYEKHRISHLSYVCCISCPSRAAWTCHPNVCWREPIWITLLCSFFQLLVIPFS
jgi:hypothetical protein